jgi:hypothetical protein
MKSSEIKVVEIKRKYFNYFPFTVERYYRIYVGEGKTFITSDAIKLFPVSLETTDMNECLRSFLKTGDCNSVVSYKGHRSRRTTEQGEGKISISFLNNNEVIKERFGDILAFKLIIITSIYKVALGINSRKERNNFVTEFDKGISYFFGANLTLTSLP